MMLSDWIKRLSVIADAIWEAIQEEKPVADETIKELCNLILEIEEEEGERNFLILHALKILFVDLAKGEYDKSPLGWYWGMVKDVIDILEESLRKKKSPLRPPSEGEGELETEVKYS
jgi:hypothetical protein